MGLNAIKTTTEKVLDSDPASGMIRDESILSSDPRSDALGRLLGLKVENIRIEELDLGDRTFQFRIELVTKRLMDDIKANGIAFPIVARMRADKLQVVSGFRRLTAARRLGLTEVPVIIVHDMPDDEAYRLSVVENEMRRSYNDLDRANAILKMTKAGMRLDELEKLFKLQRRQIQRLKRLARLPEVLRNPLAEGKIETTHALKLNELKGLFPELNLDEWVENVIKRKLSVRELDKKVRAAYKPKSPLQRLLFVEDKLKGTLKLNSRVFKLQEMTNKERRETVEQLNMLISVLHP